MSKTNGLPEKPMFGQACNQCGYCCAVQPCALAEEFLRCTTGPCTALEFANGHTLCGLVRNPLGYLFKAVHPEADIDLMETQSHSSSEQKLSHDIAEALGINKGCDTDDDDESAKWPQSLTSLTEVS
ncbi:hypothetical protein [Alcaligenes faecalis]|uniref:hypothetical protein n=1 Tax=Alcaligenes faecalis TaxID=511 RepID=UPI0024BCD943|nr:hypothetical protein [Alcaligenes faecalis]WHQ45919.1 hypothetical protein E8D21_19920 [Alcaligenes faecalis]